MAHKFNGYESEFVPELGRTVHFKRQLGAEKVGGRPMEKFPQVGKFIPVMKDLSKEHPPISEFGELGEVKYESQSGIVNNNCHLGQRKLLLTEIEMYNKVTGDEESLIIYAGSASCEHLPVILEMFPHLKFILIDPNYHSIDGDLQYIYQNLSIVEKRNWQLFNQHLKHGKSDRHRHNQRTTQMMLDTKFLTGETVDIIRTAKKYYWEGGDENDEVQQMNKIKDEFLDKKYKTLVSDVMKSDTRVFIIQDYLTIELTQKLKKSLDAYRKKAPLPMYFLTDIRTALNENEPHDIDILWNSALQVIFLKILKPRFSMLKFRPPFFMDRIGDTTDWFDKVMKGGDPPPEHDIMARIIKSDLDFVKKNYKLDLWKNYMDNKFIYLQKDAIFAQPWAPRSSSESRLFVSEKSVFEPYIEYTVKEWEDKFMWLRLYRQFAYHPLFYEKVRRMVPDYDGCYDCTRELMIIGEYLTGEASIETDMKAIAEVFDSQENLGKLEQIYNMINKYTFFGLANNYKCPTHGHIRKPPEHFIVQVQTPHELVSVKLTPTAEKDGYEVIKRKKFGDLRPHEQRAWKDRMGRMEN